ncbi:hypothetical protein FRC10_011670 [Ceratobasidium sp. 414]|nr:hypothetical protein FRC10_011670 [Ceratobasidium sp. 414]
MPEKPLLVYNFAQGGDTVGNMEKKIEGPYQELIKSKCKPGKDWSPATSLFGIQYRDCLNNGLMAVSASSSTFGEGDAGSLMSDIFKSVQTVYDTGARAFLFIDVPPVERAPLIVVYPTMSKRFGSICSMWNQLLQDQIEKFSEGHPDVRCFQFSSHRCLNDILDNPVKHGFAETDVTEYGGGIWVDNIHLTSAVHKIIAEDVLQFLKTI